MSNFIQSLESRRLMSATADTLLGDKAMISSDIVVLKAAANALILSDTSATKVIATDFKGLPKADGELLKTLETTEIKAKAALLKDVALLDSKSLSLTTKSVSAGDVVLKKATTRSLAALAKDITALGSVTTVPMADLQAFLTGTTVTDARASILTALPADSALDTAVTNEGTDSDADKATINTDANQLQNDVTGLATDLSSIESALGTFPAVTGSFTGTAQGTAGKVAGQSEAVTLNITSESASGVIEATVTNFSGGVSALAGSVSLNGVIVLKALPGNSAVTIDGVFSNSAIGGTFAFAGGKGTFAVSEIFI
jgi:hypothetical protein